MLLYHSDFEKCKLNVTTERDKTRIINILLRNLCIDCITKGDSD